MQRREEIRAGAGQRLQQHGQDAQHIPVKHDVRRTGGAVKLVAVQHQQRPGVQGIDLLIKKQLAALTQNQHQLDAIVKMQLMHLPGVILFMTDMVLLCVHGENRLLSGNSKICKFFSNLVKWTNHLFFLL